MEPIKQLATLAGLQDRYIHAQGHTQHIALADQQAILTAMGYDLTTTEAIARQISELQQKPWAEVVAPVQVIAAQQSFSVRVQQPAASACSHWQWRLVTEQQQEFSGQLQVATSDIIARQQLNETTYLAFNLLINVELQPG